MSKIVSLISVCFNLGKTSFALEIRKLNSKNQDFKY